MRRVGVLGWPVSHSLSPAMHNAAYAALGLGEWHYQKLPVPPELFAELVPALPDVGFVGANVTIPHKEAALALADQATDRARAIGAANTLTFREGSIHADNTDAPGLISAIGSLSGLRSALVLGAGGSARAVVWALVDAGLDVHVWNRTPARAVELAGELGGAATTKTGAADILVNCTSVGLADSDGIEAFPIDVGDYSCVVDLVYTSGETELIKAAQAAGARTVDGREMLLGQGAISFESWTGKDAPIEAMRQALEKPATLAD